jgi:hypothetical protein
MVGLVAAFLLAISPFHIWFSREARSYVMMALFGLLAAYFMVRALGVGQAAQVGQAQTAPTTGERGQGTATSWLGYIVLAALSAYSHFFGLLAVGALNLFAPLVLIVRRAAAPIVARWLTAQVGLALTLIPLALEFTGQTHEGWGSWIGERYGAPALKSIGVSIGEFSFGSGYDQHRRIFVAALGVFASVCVYALFAAARRWQFPDWRRRQGEPLAFVLICLAGPIGVLFFVSQFTPVYLERYLLSAVPPYLMLVALGVASIPRAAWRNAVLVGLVLITMPGLLAVYQPGQKQEWRTGAAEVAAGVQAGDLIVIYDAYAGLAFNYYYHEPTRQLAISRYASDDEMRQHVDAIAAVRGQVWMVLSHADDKRLMDLVEARPGIVRKSDHPMIGLRIVLYEVTVLP